MHKLPATHPCSTSDSNLLYPYPTTLPYSPTLPYPTLPYSTYFTVPFPTPPYPSLPTLLCPSPTLPTLPYPTLPYPALPYPTPPTTNTTYFTPPNPTYLAKPYPTPVKLPPAAWCRGASSHLPPNAAAQLPMKAPPPGQGNVMC